MDVVEIIIYICSTLITVCTAGGIVLKGFKKSFKNHVNEVLSEELHECKTEIEKQLIEINKKVIEFIEHQEDYNAQVKAALLASTRDRINQAHDYYMRKKFIGAHSLFIVEELYSSYKKLGGNSFIDHQMEDLRSLEVRSAETDLK